MHTSSTLTAKDITTVDGIRCTTVARALIDFADTARPKELARAVEETERLDLFDGRAVEAVLARANGRRGAPRLRAALAQWSEPAFTRSEAERMMLTLLAAAALPSPDVNTVVAGHEVDLHGPEHGLVVEIDGYAYHRTRVPSRVTTPVRRTLTTQACECGALRGASSNASRKP